MKTRLCVAVAVGVVGLALRGLGAEPSATVGATVASSPGDANANEPIFKKLSDLKWDKILPDLGENSPEICVLHVDPKTQATQLLIRTPKAIHVRKHWHTANESHTMISGTATLACEGKKVEIGPGGYNYMPAKMVHEGWLPAGSLTFITVDGAWDINWVEGPPTSADLSRTY
jgi:mannose-6-phosphate isomerase-like protein (cupin superfamily)